MSDSVSKYFEDNPIVVSKKTHSHTTVQLIQHAIEIARKHPDMDTLQVYIQATQQSKQN